MLTNNTRLAGGQYIIQRHLDSGAMADVYAATDTLRQTQVALKVLRSQLALDPYFEEYFRREASVLLRLQHPNIVRLYELVRDGELLFLVMDFIVGQTLQQYLYTHKLLPTAHVLYIAQALAHALDFAHSNQIIHRDIKPSNVLLATNGAILLSDFGVARVAGSTTTAAGPVGTIAYMAPEQIVGGTTTVAADQYSLAVLLWELLTGRRPFVGDTATLKSTTVGERVMEEHLHHPVPTGLLSPQLDQTLRRALSKIAAERYATCAMLVQQLAAASGVQPASRQHWLQQVQDIPKLPDPPAPTPPRPRTNWKFLAAVAVLLLAFITGISYGSTETARLVMLAQGTATQSHIEALATIENLKTTAAALPNRTTPTNTAQIAATADALATQNSSATGAAKLDNFLTLHNLTWIKLRPLQGPLQGIRQAAPPSDNMQCEPELAPANHFVLLLTVDTRSLTGEWSYGLRIRDSFTRNAFILLDLNYLNISRLMEYQTDQYRFRSTGELATGAGKRNLLVFVIGTTVSLFDLDSNTNILRADTLAIGQSGSTHVCVNTNHQQMHGALLIESLQLWEITNPDALKGSPWAP